MATEYELVRHSKMNHLKIFGNRIIYRSNHMHSFFEIDLVLDGEGTISTRHHTYPLFPGAIVFLNSNEPHSITGSGFGVTLLIIQFSRSFLHDYYPGLAGILISDGNVRQYLPPAKYAALCNTLLDAGVEYLSANTLFELTCISHLTKALRQMLLVLPKEIISETDAARRSKQEQRMARIATFLESNYQLPIRLSDLAEQEKISSTHLSHFITEHFGMTFQEYLRNIRFEHAVRIIGNPSLSLSDVSAISGFSELKYMTQTFEKQLGMKPADFREQFANIAPAPGSNGSEDAAATQTIEYYLSDEDALRAILESEYKAPTSGL